MKFVIRNCKFDGAPGWNLARHHADAQFYFIDCEFASTMTNKPIHRVIYPLGNGPATDADTKRNAQLDKVNLWGEREYFYNCHRDGGDFDWFANNLSSAANSPTSDQITTAWTFAGKWNPENKTGPTIQRIQSSTGTITVTFSENVSVKGRPRLELSGHQFADYTSGSGADTLVFKLPGDAPGEVAAVYLNGGAIIACEADALMRTANLTLPARNKP
jgi:pectinesterase